MASLCNNTGAFVRTAVGEGTRTDGRKELDMRAARITFGDTYGSAEVHLGRTRVLAVVSGALVEPGPDRPTDGSYLFVCEGSGMGRADGAESHGSRAEAGRVAGFIESVLRDSGAIETESLCVVAGVWVWAIRIDIHVLDDDGNVMDAAVLATLAGLLHFKRPDTSVDGSGNLVVHPMTQKTPLGLTLHHIPFAVSFAFFSLPLPPAVDAPADAPTSRIVRIVDPRAEEAAVADAVVVFAINAHDEVCGVAKLGGVPVTHLELKRASRIAAVKVAELAELLAAALKAESARQLHLRAPTAAPDPARPSSIGTYVIGAARIEGGAKIASVTALSSAAASQFGGGLAPSQANSLFANLPAPSHADSDSHLQARLAEFELQLEDLVMRSAVVAASEPAAAATSAPAAAAPADDDDEEEDVVIRLAPATTAE